MISVLGLNVSAPTPERGRGLLEYLWGRDEQVLVLTELTDAPGSRLLFDVCRAAGHAVVSAPLRPRERGVAVVVREPALVVDGPSSDHGPRVVSVRLDDITLIGVYGAASDPLRYSSSAQRSRKRAWLTEFDALAAEVADRDRPALVVGDLNIVDPDDDGLPYVLAEERATYAGLLDLGYVDAYRAVTGTTRPTWVDHSGVGCRYDHAFARGLRVLGAEIDDAPRVDGWTDHCALSVVVDVDPATAPDSGESGAAEAGPRAS